MLRKFFSFTVLGICLVVVVGCGDPASNANKELKPIDPNAQKPVSAGAAGPSAGAGVVK